MIVDSLFLDFMQASTSMFEAKGEGILSWCADDNFILEDDLAPDFEVLYINSGFYFAVQSMLYLKLLASNDVLVANTVLKNRWCGSNHTFGFVWNLWREVLFGLARQ